MAAWSRQIPFRVDVAGIIEIMGSSLYSRPDTPVRELIQNAHDAIVRRRQRELNYLGRIDVLQDAEARTLEFRDDGIGLSPEEAEEYLSTLGTGITGMIKRGLAGGGGDPGGLIGQFGIGMFSAFMLAETVVVESRRFDGAEPVRWMAGAGTDITLSHGSRTQPGTTITLQLKPEYCGLAADPLPLERAIREFADFLHVPIYLNSGRQRVNVIQASWFDPTPDREAMELELETYFGETPLDVIPLRQETPVSVAGALYITPQRVPGFAGEQVLTVTVRRMVISRRIQGLLPPWAGFVRGVLELNDCAPTASREDLVRDARFVQVRQLLEETLYSHLELLAMADPTRFEALVAWHRYTLAGAALDQPRLRKLLQHTYKFPTSLGALTFDDILRRSPADALFEADVEHVIWYNAERRQEAWMNTLFAGHDVPCVHALRSFEESLLGAFAADVGDVDLRTTSPGSPRFAENVLGAQDLHPAPDAWQQFLGGARARVMLAGLATRQPVMAFLNERYELLKTFDDLKQQGTIPEGFRRLIDNHFETAPAGKNEIVLNTNHRLVARALEQRTGSPLASVLRLLVANALSTAGAALPREIQRQQIDDLDWIAEALWGKTER